MTAAVLFGCETDEPETVLPDPEPEIVLPAGSNWVLEGDDASQGGVTNLRSALYKVEDDGTYTFYFSEAVGITTADGMKASPRSLLTISNVAEPAGAQSSAVVNWRTADHEYTNSNFEAGTVVLNLLYNSKATLSLEFLAAEGSGMSDLRASWEGECPETDAPAFEGNVIAIDKLPLQKIGSVVEFRNEHNGLWTYYFFENEGVKEDFATAEALLTITVPKSHVAGAVAYDEIGESTAPDFNQDFDKGLAEGTDIIYGEMPANWNHHAHGTLYAGITDDAAGPYKRDIRMDYYSDDEGRRVRLNWSGTVWATYHCDNAFSITIGESTTEHAITRVFTTGNGVTSTLLFGTVETDKCENLKAEGEKEYAVKWTFTGGPQEGTFTDVNNLASWSLYNYATLDSYTNGDNKGRNVSGKFLYANDPNGDSEDVYMLFDLTYSTGEHVSGDWYGPLTETTSENADIAPVKPVYYIKFTDQYGNELEKLEIIEVKHSTYLMQGDAYYTTFLNADCFYFIHEQSILSSYQSDYKTPRIGFNPNFVDGVMREVGVNNTVQKGDYTLYYTFRNSTYNLTYWTYTGSFPNSAWLSNMQTAYDAQMQVSQDKDTGMWSIYLRMQDNVVSSTGFSQGGRSYNYMIIEYSGSVTEE